MNTRVPDVKKRRRIFSFEPDPDVDLMLEKARGAGLTLADILNAALRQYGQATIRGLIAKQRKKLDSLSFSQLDLRLGEFSLAA